jgi:signal transduction histidine kinase
MDAHECALHHDGPMNASAAPQEKASPPAVLAIDDEPGMREMLLYGLTKRGYRVAVAATGEEGLAKLSADHFELAICDIMMPGIGGVEALRRIREISPETQVVMATGFATIETAIESMRRGAFDYITKPYGLPQLCSILEKALEWRRLQARIDHLEELHRLKDEFMATISHELRTPITVILGYSALLRDPAYSAEELEKGLTAIESKAKGLLKTINNIIDLTSVSAKRDPLVFELCSVADIGREVVEAMAPVAVAKKLSLTLEAPQNLRLETDRTKVRQILVNLVDNGIKFTAAGHVIVRVNAADDQHVRIEVEDTGIGIESANLPLLFQEFQQIDQSTTRPYGGTGLGLAVSERFVDLLGGTIAVESQPGKGSTFTVLLPGRRPDDQNPPKPSVTPVIHADQGPRVLLVVDDDPGITRLFQNLLTREGYAVTTADGGQAALTRMSTLKPDVLLLDLMMPDLNGFDVLASMAANPALEGVRVFIMTAKNLTQGERARLQSRAELIIQKGSKDLPEILALLNQNLKRYPRA